MKTLSTKIKALLIAILIILILGIVTYFTNSFAYCGFTAIIGLLFILVMPNE